MYWIFLQGRFCSFTIHSLFYTTRSYKPWWTFAFFFLLQFNFKILSVKTFNVYVNKMTYFKTLIFNLAASNEQISPLGMMYANKTHLMSKCLISIFKHNISQTDNTRYNYMHVANQVGKSWRYLSAIIFHFLLRSFPFLLPCL